MDDGPRRATAARALLPDRAGVDLLVLGQQSVALLGRAHSAHVSTLDLAGGGAPAVPCLQPLLQLINLRLSFSSRNVSANVSCPGSARQQSITYSVIATAHFIASVGIPPPAPGFSDSAMTSAIRAHWISALISALDADADSSPLRACSF